MKLPNIPYYHVDRLLSSGGTAAVYRGIDLRSGYVVAIKALFSTRAKDNYILEHFRSEANNYIYLSHPNLVKLVDFVENNGRYYLIMEFIDGTPMDLYLNTVTGPMSEEVLVPMFMQVLSTVAYLHHQKILHLDIKPNNIMILNDRSIKVIDLGISAKITDRNIKKAGTPPFMAPEQIKNHYPGFYTDIFALGVTLFNMVTGRLPFRGSATEILDQNCMSSRPNILDFYPGANPKYQAIIERAMNPDKNIRYQTCEEMMVDMLNIKE